MKNTRRSHRPPTIGKADPPAIGGQELRSC